MLALVLLAFSCWSLRDDWRELRSNVAKADATLLDIGGNTWAAAVRFVDYGQNPYTHRTQLHPIVEAPGVTVSGDRVEMYGVPYYYGYPYFPAMFLSYAPFRLIEPGQHSIRIGNAFWMAAALAGVAWLAFRLSPRDRRPPAAGFAVLLLVSSAGLSSQLFYFGITDLLIPVYVLFALVALTYRRHLAAGALMGLALATKILPGLLIATIFLVWLARRGGWKPALAGFAATSAIFLVPFILWNPAGFLSATILFYLTHHAAGDSTSLWFYLPAALRTPFLLVGGLGILAVSLQPLWSASDDQRDLLRWMVIATLLFLAFNKMIHLNYQFAIVPLACVALAADAMGRSSIAVES